MQSFSYKDNRLGALSPQGWIALEDVVKNKNHPVYVYNLASFSKRIEFMRKELDQTNTRMYYALKANSNSRILATAKAAQLGVDVVSGGEAQWALENGFSGKDIIFSGVGKSKEEITLALEKDFYQINAESLEEIVRIASLAKTLNKKARLGIRINPNIKPDTHPYITTGFRENKFGISEYQIQDALQIINQNKTHLELTGLSAHIGSQIRDIKPLIETIQALVSMARNLSAQGHNLRTLDFGGGIGIDYSSDDETSEFTMMQNFSKEIRRVRKEFSGEFLLEPGRTLVARCGVLLTQVEYVKFNGYKKFLIVNTGMHHLLRPALYKAHHRILPLNTSNDNLDFYDVVGPICESSDVLGHDRQFPPVEEGAWLAIMDAGAYGMSMSSFYNRHLPPEEICIG
jgi:diaminopimelate decarboxylase